MRVVIGTVAVVFVGLVTFGSVTALSGCGSDHTAGVVFDDDPEPAPTLTPAGGGADSRSLPTPTITPAQDGAPAAVH